MSNRISCLYLIIFTCVFNSCKKPKVPTASTKDIDVGTNPVNGLSGQFSVSVPIMNQTQTALYTYNLNLNNGQALFSTTVVNGGDIKNANGSLMFKSDANVPLMVSQGAPNETVYTSTPTATNKVLTVVVTGNAVTKISYFGYEATILAPQGTSLPDLNMNGSMGGSSMPGNTVPAGGSPMSGLNGQQGGSGYTPMMPTSPVGGYPAQQQQQPTSQFFP